MKLKEIIFAFALLLPAISLGVVEMETDQKSAKSKPTKPQSSNPKRQAFYIRYAPGKKGSFMASASAAGYRIDHHLDDYDTLAVSIPEGAVNTMATLSNVVFSEPVPEYKMQAQLVPWNIDQFQGREVWDSDLDGIIDPGAADGSGVRLCIIDSGFWAAHDDFQGITHSGMSQIPGELYTEDGNGHGTHVAGTANAVNNNIGVVGVTPGGAELIIVKIFNNSGLWSAGNSNLATAVTYCRDQGANAISMSLGGGYSATEESVFLDVYDNYNMISIAAAGNDGDENGGPEIAPSYPASYDSVISVAALRQSDNVADFSQYPATAYDPLNQPANVVWDSVELSGGGEGVLSTWPGPPHENVPLYRVTNDGTDYTALVVAETANGDVTQNLVDGNLCDAGDIDISWTGSVVLCERGAISFADKMNNVADNGGVAVVIYNNVAGALAATCGGNCVSGALIPGVSITQADGQFLQTNGLGLPTRVLADDGSGCIGCSGGYNTISGTSMSTPGVAAGIAWTWDACGGPTGITNKQLRQLLRDSARDLSGTHDYSGNTYGPGWDPHTGFGLVQLKDALELGNTLYGSTCPLGLSVTPAVIDVCTIPTASDVVYGLTLSSNFTGTSNLTSSGVPAGASGSFTPASVVFPATNSDFTVSGLDNIPFGSAIITLTATDDSDPGNNASVDASLNTFAALPAGLLLSAPVDTSTISTLAPTFNWSSASQALTYTLEVATDPAFLNIVASEAGLTLTSHALNSALSPSTTYYWRVTAINPCGDQVSAVFSFTTENEVCAIYTSADVPQAISISPAPGDVTSVLSIGDSGGITDVNVVGLTGTHTWINDVIFSLRSPASTEIVLMNRVCSLEDDWDLEFDDEAAPGALPCPPIGGGSYQPGTALSAFNGEDLNGDWIFTVNDSIDLDGGSFDSWGLEICYLTAGANTPPVADDDSYSTDQGTVLNVAAPGVLLGDTDVDTDPLTAINGTQPANGSVSLNADGSFSYTPDANYCNDGLTLDTFTYQAFDGTDPSVAATVSLTVNCNADSIFSDSFE